MERPYTRSPTRSPDCDGNLRQREGGIHGVIELCETQVPGVVADPRAKQAAGIQHDPDRLASLDLIGARGELMTPGRGRPVDVANVIALPVFAKGFEFPADSALPPVPLLHIDLAAADQV